VATVSPDLSSKPVVIVFSGLASKSVATVSLLASKLVAEDFPVWISKPATTVW
jgi:hypothetical protein